MDNEIYLQLKENSIGVNKVAPLKVTKKKITLAVTVAMLVSTLLTSCAPYIEKKENNNSCAQQATIFEEDSDKYDSMDIRLYGLSMAKNILYRNGLSEYEMVNNQRKYNYTVEDYKKMQDLDESYLYGFYMLMTEDSFNTIINLFGCNNLDEYLIKNNYIDQEGKPNINMWLENSKEEILKIMLELEGAKTR